MALGWMALKAISCFLLVSWRVMSAIGCCGRNLTYLNGDTEFIDVLLLSSAPPVLNDDFTNKVV